MVLKLPLAPVEGEEDGVRSSPSPGVFLTPESGDVLPAPPGRTSLSWVLGSTTVKHLRWESALSS